MEEAARWLARLELGTADLEAFEAWRGADPRHALAFARVYASAEALSTLAPENARVAPAHAASLPRRHFLRNVGAGAALAVGGSAFFAARALAWDRASTAVGEFREVRLPNGSVVSLNTDTAIAWRFEPERRRLWLERGEIALDLGPGAPASFSCAGGSGETALSAGRFIARLHPGKVDLLVLRGTALVPGRGTRRPVAVATLQEASLSDTVPLVAPASEERISSATAWQNREIEFDDARLAEAVADYNRYLTRKIVIDDPRLADLRIGGRFSSTDPEAFLQALALGLDLRVIERADAVHILPNK